MSMSGQKGFEGWYFKHQKGDDMVAFIPGQAESGAFIQLISQEGAKQFEISDLTICDGMARLTTDHLRHSVPISWGHSGFSPWSVGTAFSAWHIPSRAAS